MNTGEGDAFFVPRWSTGRSSLRSNSWLNSMDDGDGPGIDYWVLARRCKSSSLTECTWRVQSNSSLSPDILVTKVNVSRHVHEATFQERRRGVSKRPYLQKYVKIATRDDPLKVEHRFYASGAPGEFGFIMGFLSAVGGFWTRNFLPLSNMNSKW